MSGSPLRSPATRKSRPNVSGAEETDPTGRYIRFADVLGRGADKCVFMAFDRVEGKEVAWNQVPVLPDVAARLQSEVHLLSQLDHRNILKMYASWHDPVQHNINFITELFSSGTLRQYSQKYRSVEMNAIKRWSRQILRGLLYLHSHDPPIIHRDLKCENIFVNGNRGELKIGDLGLAKILENKGREAHSVIGTPEYMAPELYDESYTELVDVYAFGMCLLEVVTGEYPYCECSNAAQVYKRVSEGKQPQSLNHVKDPQVRHIIELCISPERRRPAVRDLMLLPFLAEEALRATTSIASISSYTQLADEEVGRRHSHPLRGSQKLGPEITLQNGAFVPILGMPTYGGSHTWSPAARGREQLWAGSVVQKQSCDCSEATEALANRDSSPGTTSARRSESDFTFDDTVLLVKGAGASRGVLQANPVTPPECAPGLVPGLPADRGFKIRGKVTSSTEIKLRLRIEDEDGNVQTVRFLFDLSQDTPLAVATEMIDELALTDRDVSIISDKISAEIRRLVPSWSLQSDGSAEVEALVGAAIENALGEIQPINLQAAGALATLAPLPSSSSVGAASHLSASFNSTDGGDQHMSQSSGESPDHHALSSPKHPPVSAAAAIKAVSAAFKAPDLPPLNQHHQFASCNGLQERSLHQLRDTGGGGNSADPTDKRAILAAAEDGHHDTSERVKEDLSATDGEKRGRFGLPRKSGSVSHSGRRIISRTSSRTFAPMNSLQSNRCVSEQVPGIGAADSNRFALPAGLPRTPTGVLQQRDHGLPAEAPGHRANTRSIQMPVQRSISTTEDATPPAGTPPKVTTFWSGDFVLVPDLGEGEETLRSRPIKTNALGAVDESPEKNKSNSPDAAPKSPSVRGTSLLQRQLKAQQQIQSEAVLERLDSEQGSSYSLTLPLLVGSLPSVRGSDSDVPEALEDQEITGELGSMTTKIKQMKSIAPINGESKGIDALSPGTRARAMTIAIKRNSGPLEQRRAAAASLDKRTSGNEKRGWGAASSMERIKLGGMDKTKAEQASYVELKVTWVQAHEEKSVSVGAPGVDLKRLLHLENAPHLVREGSNGHLNLTAQHSSDVISHAEKAYPASSSSTGAPTASAAAVADHRVSEIIVTEPGSDEEAKGSLSADGSAEVTDTSEVEEERELNVMEEALTELLQHFQLSHVA